MHAGSISSIIMASFRAQVQIPYSMCCGIAYGYKRVGMMFCCYYNDDFTVVAVCTRMVTLIICKCMCVYADSESTQDHAMITCLSCNS